MRKITLMSYLTQKEVKLLKKGLVLLMAGAMIFAFAGIAMAADPTGFGPSSYAMPGATDPSWNYYEQGKATTSGTYSGSVGLDTSVHPYGTWNSPYTIGIDGYNYNDAQDYVNSGEQTSTAGDTFHYESYGAFGPFQYDGPKFNLGGFSCFDCHSPHANPQRILGFNDEGNPIPSIVNANPNSPDYGAVYNIGNPGHDMFKSGGEGYAGEDAATLAAQLYLVPAFGNMPLPNGKAKPYYLAGSWLLIKNPDKEIADPTDTTQTVDSPVTHWGGSSVGWVGEAPLTVAPGQEISDVITAGLNEYDKNTTYPVNKMPIDWNDPIGSSSIWDEDFNQLFPGYGLPTSNRDIGTTSRSPFCRSFILDEFCTDCHDGNGGSSKVKAPLFSEERALRVTASSGSDGNTDNFRASYDLAYGHDANIRH